MQQGWGARGVEDVPSLQNWQANTSIHVGAPVH